jgi:hypothetical protein
MSADKPAQLLRAIYIDPDDDTATWLGDVALDGDGYLRVAALNEELEDGLSGFVDEMNGRDSFRVKVPPPPNAPMFQLYGKTYERSDPNFLKGLKDYALSLYGLKLCTDEDLARERDEQKRLAL